MPDSFSPTTACGIRTTWAQFISLSHPLSTITPRYIAHKFKLKCVPKSQWRRGLTSMTGSWPTCLPSTALSLLGSCSPPIAHCTRPPHPALCFCNNLNMYTAACAALPLQHACQIESPVFQALQVAWEDVLIQYNVTLAATAHIHYYERTCAVAHGVCVNSSSLAPSQHAASPASVQPQPAPIGAPVYVVVGPAGCLLALYRFHCMPSNCICLNTHPLTRHQEHQSRLCLSPPTPLGLHR